MSLSRSPSHIQTSLELDETRALPTLTTFLRDVPPQLTVLLAELGPYILAVRRFAEAASWKSEFADSWILLGIWWTLCLLSQFAIRYFLLLIAAALYMYLAIRPPPKNRPPITEQTLQATVIDLSVIESLLPSVPHPKPLPLNVILRVLAISYIPSLVLTHFLRTRVILGLLGTIIFIWRARWAVNIRESVWRSAWFRHGLANAWALLSGRPPEIIVLSTSSLPRTSETAQTVRFLITIYENQRWWVGLDWTSALIPSERPSWCSSSLEPMPPPSAFSLPPPTTTYVGDGRGGLVKRTAAWSWDESEWKVSVRKELGLKRVEKELPSPKDDANQPTNRVGKAKQKMHETGQKLIPHRDIDSKDVDQHAEDDPNESEPTSDLQDVDSDDQITDNDGWVYGDNKWNGFSSSGGLGKYTRFRKWTRIATLMEIVEPASAVEAHSHAAEKRGASVSADNERKESASRRSIDDNRRQSVDEVGVEEDDGEPNGLRKRLKSVIRKAASNPQG